MSDTGSWEPLLESVRAVQHEIDTLTGPPPAGGRAGSESVIARSVAQTKRTYVNQIVEQINGSYEKGYYDACAVMIRRLLETLIIEAFEHAKDSAAIQAANGEFVFLRDLIDAALAQPSWNLGRNCKQAMPRLKDVGDKSAHSRRFLAHRSDIEKVTSDLRTVVQELVLLAELQ